MISRVLPYPLLTVSLIIFWMTINSFSAGHLLLGTGVALIASWAMASLRPAKPRIRNWHKLVKLIAIVLYDIVLSNISVVKIILFQRERSQIRFPRGAAGYSRSDGIGRSGDNPHLDTGKRLARI